MKPNNGWIYCNGRSITTRRGGIKVLPCRHGCDDDCSGPQRNHQVTILLRNVENRGIIMRGGTVMTPGFA